MENVQNKCGIEVDEGMMDEMIVGIVEQGKLMVRVKNKKKDRVRTGGKKNIRRQEEQGGWSNRNRSE